MAAQQAPDLPTPNVNSMSVEAAATPTSPVTSPLLSPLSRMAESGYGWNFQPLTSFPSHAVHAASSFATNLPQHVPQWATSYIPSNIHMPTREDISNLHMPKVPPVRLPQWSHWEIPPFADVWSAGREHLPTWAVGYVPPQPPHWTTLVEPFRQRNKAIIESLAGSLVAWDYPKFVGELQNATDEALVVHITGAPPNSPFQPIMNKEQFLASLNSWSQMQNTSHSVQKISETLDGEVILEFTVAGDFPTEKGETYHYQSAEVHIFSFTPEGKIIQIRKYLDFGALSELAVHVEL
eukprot:NODE_2356_length_1139_cov_30.513761_g1958_i0.p2 GENE.NODE_2356_length_1139_cov_30.513761_g1958_i0~~NODE_2356_length_1139_cov_30.513761_g1958_i0.p2  ORF type:complete len:294 (+),score=67.84 NODE_2356_length_1139_cov_30.513761_g1958_i0:124-1005(+)